MDQQTSKPTKRKQKHPEVAPIWGVSAVKPTPRNAPITSTPAFAMNTTIGQHILQNPQIAQSIVDKSNLQPTDIVLEIGPGTGNLTMRILEKASKVIVIEMDPRMARELGKRGIAEHTSKKLDIILGDCMKVDFPYHDLCISNMPYQISSPIIYKLLGLNRPPRVSILMFQHEFNLRLLARPGESSYGRISATVQRFAKVSLVMKVGRNNFRPPPAVESSVVRIEMKPTTATTAQTEQEAKDEIKHVESQHAHDFKEWDGLLRICFVRKNKTISACFKSTAVMEALEKNYRDSIEPKNEEKNEEKNEQLSIIIDDDVKAVVKEKINRVLRDSGYASRRSQKCDETDFETLLNAFHEAGITFSALQEVDTEN